MIYFLMILVGSVFLGTEFLAIPTPVAQMTIYRVFALSVIPLLFYFVIKKDVRLKISINSYSTASVGMYLFWWIWAIASVVWVIDIASWLQGVFLLTLGISSILALYFWLNNMHDWLRIIKVVWVMMSLLVFLGYFEIITNTYFFADLGKLDKYRTFAAQPLTRIPVTHFENQNDFATMLLAYLPINLILFHSTNNIWKRLIHIFSMMLAAVLIIQTQSRMALLCLILYFVCLFALKFKWDFKRWHVISFVAAAAIGASLMVLFIPALQTSLSGLIYSGNEDFISGDMGRINLWRNGLVFLAQTFGLGVGANNIEKWMELFGILPTNDIVNIHNWWLEILVGYGVIVFILYVVCYGLIIHRLLSLNRNSDQQQRYISNSIIAFLIIFIAASVTSANNMLIEWHWLFFGIIISYVSILERNNRHKKVNRCNSTKEMRIN